MFVGQAPPVPLRSSAHHLVEDSALAFHRCRVDSRRLELEPSFDIRQRLVVGGPYVDGQECNALTGRCVYPVPSSVDDKPPVNELCLDSVVSARI